MLTVGQYYRVTWQLLIILAAALAVGSEVVRPLVLIPFFLIAYARVTPLSGILSQNKKRVSWGIGFALFLLTIHQIMRFQHFDELVEVLIEMISGTLPLMLLNHERPRSYWLSILNVTIVAISSITFTSSVPIYLGFIAFVGVLLLNLNAASLYQAAMAERGTVPTLPRGYFRQFAYVLPPGAFVAALIFFMFPRVQTFGTSLGNLMAKSRTGYAGLVTLSGQGEIEPSQELAFMLDGQDKGWLRKAAPTLLFRGDSLDSFDGVRWTNNVFNYRTQEQAQDLRVASRHSQSTRTLMIHVEPTPSNAVFYPSVLINVVNQSPSAGSFLYNATGSVIRTQFSLERFNYTVKVADALPIAGAPDRPIGEIAGKVPTRPEREVFPNEMGNHDLDAYLAVPVGVRDSPWFKAWVAEVGIDPAVDGIAAVDRKVQEHFRTKFKATLKNTFSQQNTLSAFLTADRQGHCEYFATATALLLRTFGVPSRVVVGYRGGHYNDLIDVVEVTEESAHAWVEAFLPDFGWQTLDPTPDGGGAAVGTSEWRHYLTAMSFWFRQYVVDYDQSTQRELVKTLKNLANEKHGKPLDWRALATRYGKQLAFCVVAIVGALAIAMGARRRRVAKAMPRYYRVFLARVGAKDLRRHGGETMREFHARCAAGGFDAGTVAAVDRAIEADFYGAAPDGEGARQALVERCAQLKLAR